MADYDINANITANTKGYEAGIKKAQESTKKFSTSISKVIQGLGKNGLVGALGSIGLASAGLSATLGAVVKIAKQVSQAIGECTEAYKKQNIAEISLKTAMQNNPLTNGQGTKQLREFASEMQRTSNMGDEEIIPFMTQLIASGRTEAETMKIIKTASDMASSGAMSFDTAVTQLNATLNGNIGRLGQQNAELKGLTEEELKNGKAVDILAEKYKGLSEATIDTKKQLENAIGDLRESFGSVFEKAFSPMRSFFAEIIQGWADARKAKQEYEGAVQAVASGNADIEQLQIVIDANEKKLEDFNKVVEQKAQEFKKTREEILQNWIMYLTSDEMEQYSAGDLFGPKQAEEIERQNYLLNGRIRLMNKINEAEEKAKQKRAEGEEAEAERLERDKKANELKEEYLKKIAEQEARWRHIKEVTGESVSNEEKMKFYQDALVDLMTKSGGLITTDNELYKEQMEIIEALATVGQKGKADISSWEDKLLAQQIERLEVMKDIELKGTSSASKQYAIEHEYGQKILDLKLKQLEIERDKELAKIEGTENAEEARKKILEYYAEQERLLRIKSKDHAQKTDEETISESKKSWKEIAKNITGIMKKAYTEVGKVAKGIKDMIQSVAQGIGKILKEVGSMFKNGFSVLKSLLFLDIDDSLIKILEFEDRVLTFFTETLPKIPSFVAAALQSIQALFQTLENSVDSSLISNIIQQMVQSLVTTLPSILSTLGNVISKIIGGILDGIGASLPSLNDLAEQMGEIFAGFASKIKEQSPKFKEVINGIAELLSNFVTGIVDSGLIDDISEIASDIVTTLADGLDTMLPTISKALGALIPAIGDFIRKSIPSIINLLMDFIGVIAENLPSIISELIKTIPVLISSIIEKLPKFFKEDLPKLLTGLIEIIPDIIKVAVDLTVEIIKHLPEIIGSIITGLIKGFASVNWWEVVKSIFQAFIDGFKKLFGINSPSTVFEGFGKNIFQGLKNGLKGIGEWFTGIFTKAIDGIKTMFGNLKNWFSDLWDKITGKTKQSTEEMIREQRIASEMAKGVNREVAERIVDDKPLEEYSTDKFKVYGVTKVGYANGSQAVKRGLAMVGEAGPELVKFRGGEQVLNAKNTQKALSGAGTSNSFNVTFNNLQDTTAFALMQQLKQYNRQMAINGII